MKKVMKLFFLCALLLSSMQIVSAQETYVVDPYDQFTNSEEQYYDSLASDFETKYDMSVYLLNLETTDVDPIEEAKRIYREISENENTLILAYSDAYYLLQPYGDAISIVNDSLWEAYNQEMLTMEERFDAFFQELEFFMVANEDTTEKGAYFVDDADLFDASQEASLLQLFKDVSNDLGIDVVGVTTTDMNGNDAEQYARQYYYDYNYNENGIILMIDMDDRAWALVSMGDARNVFVTNVRDNMSDDFVPYLSDGEYEEAYRLYARQVASYVDLYDEHEDTYQDAIDEYVYNENKGYYFMMGTGIGLVAGLIIAFVVRMILVKQCKMVELKPQARDYLVKNSMVMRKSHDYFLYSNVVRTARPKDDDSSSSRSSSSFDSGGSSGRF